MSDQGEAMVQKLVDHHLWVDLAHSNDLQVAKIVPMMIEKRLPLLVTHTSLREHYAAERALSPMIIRGIQQVSGMVGLLPSDQVLNVDSEPCYSGLSLYRKEFKSLAESIGDDRITVGTDSNAPLSNLSPICETKPNQILSQFEQTGYRNYDDLPSLAGAMSPGPDWEPKVIDRFLKEWEKIRPSR
jgi:microsomal dipeptidase-like Zn-dependent dipeptidase